MKKNSCVLLLFTILAIPCFSQNNPTVYTNVKKIGKNFLTGKPITADEYTFTDRVNRLNVDSANNNLSIELRGISYNEKWLENNGTFMYFNTKEKEVIWSREVSFQTEEITQIGNHILYLTNNTSSVLDTLTGETLSETNNLIVYVDIIHNIGLGLNPNSTNNDHITLEGVDLSTGKIIWKREIHSEYGWDGIVQMNDSTLLICASGLHSLNIFNGKGWGYQTITGKRDYKRDAITTGLGLASGLLTGIYVYSIGDPHLISNVSSNVLIDSTYIYFASGSHVVKLDLNGELIWEQRLPEDLTSKSLIFKSNNNLIMINRGYGYIGNRQVKTGTPFISAFDLNSGKKRYLTTLSKRKRSIIQGIEVYEDELLLVFPHHVTKFSTVKRKVEATNSFMHEDYGELKYSVGNEMYYLRDSALIKLSELDSTKYFIQSDNENVFILNQNLKIIGQIGNKHLFSNYLTMNGKSFYKNDNTTIVTDSGGNKIAEFSSAGKTKYRFGKLYNSFNKTLLIIDLEDILN